MEKLDLNGVRIYSNTKDDAKDAMDLIGKDVYLSEWTDFSAYTKDKLTSVIYAGNGDHPFWCKGGTLNSCGYRYFILAKDAKFIEKKTLRPFESMQEFCKETGIERVGDTITIKRKENAKDIIPTEHILLFTGFCAYTEYSDNKILDVCLGCRSYTLEELRDDYLYLKDDEWHPFGVEE